MDTKIRLLIIIFLAGGLFFSSCQEELTDPADYKVELDPSKTPDVSTKDPAKVSASYAILSASTQLGTDDRGFLIATNADFSDQKVFASADSTADFTARAGSLAPGTTYHFKAYSATIDGGVKMGEAKSFTTKEGFDAFSISTENSVLEDWTGAGFSTIDMDADGHDWRLTYYDEDAGQVAFISNSWSGDPLTPNNYLLFPEIELDGVDGAVTASFLAADGDWYAEHFKIAVHNEPITEENADEAVIIYEHTLASGDIYTATADIPAAFEGGSVYIAIIHTDCTDMYAIYFLGATVSFAK